MEFKRVTNKEGWNSFIKDSLSTDILQSWEWGETKRIEGWEPHRFILTPSHSSSVPGVDDGIAAMVLLKKVPWFGNLAYLPHAPIYSSSQDLTKYWSEFSNELIKWAKTKNVFMIEIEPKLAEDDELVAVMTKIPLDPPFEKGEDSRGKVSGRNRQPKYKLLLDITQSEEEILAQMEKNTRYNIGYAERKGVQVRSYQLDDERIEQKLDQFYDLVLQMQQRAGGYPVRSKEYFKRLTKEFRDSNNCLLFESSFQGEILAMNFTFFTDVWASSFYAGSNRKHSNVKAPYLLRWRSIQEAKKHGCEVYDFWGIVPGSQQHKGYSDHKLSFGGERVNFVGIIEYPLKPFYSKIWPFLLRLRGII